MVSKLKMLKIHCISGCFCITLQTSVMRLSKYNQSVSIERLLITHTHTLPIGRKEHYVSISQFPKFNSPGEKTFKQHPLVVAQ